MQAEQAVFLRDYMINSMHAEHALTRGVLEAVLEDETDFRPNPAARTAGELAWHIPSAEHMFCEAVINGAFEFGRKRPDQVKSPADIGRWYAEKFADDMSRLANVSPEHLTKPIDFRGLFKFPAVVYLQLGLNHSIHHRGQLSTYLRPMGAKVPAIYGESYDSAQAKQAAK